MDTDPFMNLCDCLCELQIELASRAWEGDGFDRCRQASDFRQRLWDAIAAYRDSYVDMYRS